MHPPASALQSARILSIQQPWPAAIIHGKSPENRSWQRNYRGLLILHASAALDHQALTDPRITTALAGVTALPRGAVVAVATLTDIHRDNQCCRPWGDPGAFHWTLTDVIALPTPVPWRGGLGLRHVPADLVSLITRSFADESGVQHREGNAA